MPTGYTAPVMDGRVKDLRTFAMNCAKAFGACISMRDDPMDAEIPDEFAPGDFYEKELTKARVELAALAAMSDAECESAALETYDHEVEEDRAAEARYRTEDARLNAMLAEVTVWDPPTDDHAGLKDFMVQQIKTSMNGKFDSWRKPLRMTGPEWRAARAARLRENVTHYASEQAKEVERACGRTEWVRNLRASLPEATA